MPTAESRRRTIAIAVGAWLLFLVWQSLAYTTLSPGPQGCGPILAQQGARRGNAHGKTGKAHAGVSFLLENSGRKTFQTGMFFGRRQEQGKFRTGTCPRESAPESMGTHGSSVVE